MMRAAMAALPATPQQSGAAAQRRSRPSAYSSITATSVDLQLRTLQERLRSTGALHTPVAQGKQPVAWRRHPQSPQQDISGAPHSSLDDFTNGRHPTVRAPAKKVLHEKLDKLDAHLVAAAAESTHIDEEEAAESSPTDAFRIDSPSPFGRREGNADASPVAFRGDDARTHPVSAYLSQHQHQPQPSTSQASVSPSPPRAEAAPRRPATSHGLNRREDKGTRRHVGMASSLQRSHSHAGLAMKYQRQLGALLEWQTSHSHTEKLMPTWCQEARVAELAAAAKRFDREHKERTRAALHHLETCSPQPVPRRFDGFAKAVVEVSRGRIQKGERRHCYGLGAEHWTKGALFQTLGDDEKQSMEATRHFQSLWGAAPKPKAAPNIWNFRARGSDSRGLFDADAAISEGISLDFSLALRHGLAEFLLDTVGSASIEQELDVILQTLQSSDNARLIYQTFDYLTCVDELQDCRSISARVLSQFLKDGKLDDGASKHCTRQHIDQTVSAISVAKDLALPLPISPEFIERRLHPVAVSGLKGARRQTTATSDWGAIQAIAKTGAFSSDEMRAERRGKSSASLIAPPAGSTPTRSASAAHLSSVSDQSKKMHKGNLVRHHWLHALVRVAILRYYMSGKRSVVASNNIPDAIERTLNDILANCDVAITQCSDHFRRAHCYSAAMQATLTESAPSLRSLFTAFNTKDTKMGKMDDVTRMSLSEWLEFLEAFHLTGIDVSTRSARLAFIWSRPFVVNEHRLQSQQRLAALSFEDFLEAFVRLALMKAWPNPKKLEASGFGTIGVGHYFDQLQAEQPETYTALLHDRAVPWEYEPFIPDTDCVRLLLALIQHRIGDTHNIFGALELPASGADATDGKQHRVTISLSAVRSWKTKSVAGLLGKDAPPSTDQ